MKAVLALLVSALLGAATASAADLARESPREKALMLYFSKSIGGYRSARSPLAFGLRLQQSSPFDTGRALALVDARFRLGGPRVLALAGVPALSLGRTGEEEDDGSSGDLSGAIRGFGSRHPGWTIAMIVGSVLAGACLAEWGICEDDPNPSSPYEPPAPTGPT
jgi:hypothetical protein